MWLSQIARASSNTKFVQKVKFNPGVARNQTATIENNVATNPGQTAIVNAQDFLTGLFRMGRAQVPATRYDLCASNNHVR